MATKTYRDAVLGPGDLGRRVKAWLEARFFETQVVDEEGLVLVQARKTGFPRTFLAANRALNVLIEARPEGLRVEINVGRWIENLTVVGLASYALGPAGLVFTGLMAGLSAVLEQSLWAYIDEQLADRT